MSDEQIESGQDESATRDVASPGVLLQRACRDRGVSMDELISQTKLTRQTIEALQSDDFETLNEPVYIRGYYRKCAKVLEMDESELLQAHDAAVGGVVPRLPSYRASVEKPPRTSQDWMPWLVYGLIGGSLLMLVLWLMKGGEGNNGASPESTQAATTLSVPVTDTKTASDRVPGPSVNLRSSEALSAAEVEESEALAGPEADSSERTSEVATTDAISRGLLKLNFKDTCWVRVEDADGERLLAGLMSAGRGREVQGKPPYTVFLGYAPGVTLEIDGQPVDFSEYVQSNNTARFSVTVE